MGALCGYGQWRQLAEELPGVIKLWGRLIVGVTHYKVFEVSDSALARKTLKGKAGSGFKAPPHLEIYALTDTAKIGVDDIRPAASGLFVDAVS